MPALRGLTAGLAAVACGGCAEGGVETFALTGPGMRGQLIVR